MQDIFKFIKDNIISSGEKSCPPLILGVGIGATMDKAAVLSKEAFFNRDTTNHEKAFISDLKKYLGEIANDILHIHIKTCATHIACLPVALTMNCHSSRHAECKITSENIKYKNSVLNTKDLPNETDKIKEVYTDDIDSLTKLQKGEKILLTGTIYTARDAAHKRLYENFKAAGEVPFGLKDKIIFYAGPCPAKSEEVIGPIGPTTSYRMDKYTDFIYSNGVIATVGKGERSEEALDIIKKHNGKYFVAQGGIACLLANCVKSSEIIAFKDLGTEAIRKLYVEKLPLTVVI